MVQRNEKSMESLKRNVKTSKSSNMANKISNFEHWEKNHQKRQENIFQVKKKLRLRISTTENKFISSQKETQNFWSNETSSTCR